MCRLRFALSIGLALAAVVALGDGARAAGFLEKNLGLSGQRYDGIVPFCDEPAALARIASRFAEKESRYWNSALQIVGFDHLRETAFMPWPPGAIPRRFCRGVATVSDGIRRPVYYWIGEDTGMIGASWGVEWCVDGLDRNLAFHPHCKMARP